MYIDLHEYSYLSRSEMGLFVTVLESLGPSESFSDITKGLGLTKITIKIP